MKKFIAGLAGVLVCAASAQAALLMSFQEVGSDVIGTMSGSLNLSGMSATTGFTSSVIGAETSAGIFGTGPIGSVLTRYIGQISGPASFGIGGNVSADSTTGDAVFFYATLHAFWVPDTYISGDALSGSLTFLNDSFTSLGATAGDHVYTLTSGDTITVRFANAVPLPASLPLSAAALAALALVRRRRQP